MFHLVYVSTAVRPFTGQELLELLEQSRVKNIRRQVTGLLLYNQSSFMQALEGEEEAVLSLFETICADARHHDVRKLLTLTVPGRQFPDWSMGFRNLDDPGVDAVPGYRPLKELPPWVDILHWRASVAMRLLASFNEET